MLQKQITPTNDACELQKSNTFIPLMVGKYFSQLPDGMNIKVGFEYDLM